MMWLNTIVGRTSGAAATKALSSVRYSSIGLHERTASGQIILPLDVEETVTCFCRFDICICLYTIFIHARSHFLIDLCLFINSFLLLLLSLSWLDKFWPLLLLLYWLNIRFRFGTQMIWFLQIFEYQKMTIIDFNHNIRVKNKFFSGTV